MRTVLIVDDEPLVRRGLGELMTSVGAFDKVVEAQDGREALRLAGRIPVDLVLTDVSMPDMDGLEFIREFRMREQAIPIIVVSGHGNFSYAQAALRHGATDYLLKPVNRLELTATIARVMGPVEGDDAEESGVSSLAIRKALRYIEGNLDGDLTLSSVAAVVSLSPQYLSSLFKQQVGVTFVEHVTKVRINQARKLLAGTQLKVYEIAALCGYRNAKTFMTSFRAATGSTANEYRQQHSTGATS